MMRKLLALLTHSERELCDTHKSKTPAEKLKPCSVKVLQKSSTCPLGENTNQKQKKNCEEGMEIRAFGENGDCDRSSRFIGWLGASAEEIRLQEEKQL